MYTAPQAHSFAGIIRTRQLPYFNVYNTPLDEVLNLYFSGQDYEESRNTKITKLGQGIKYKVSVTGEYSVN